MLTDYHLLILLIVPMALAAEPRPPAARDVGINRVTLVVTCLLLAPKNYLYSGLIDSPISLQVAVNPLLLVLAVVAVLVSALSRQATAPAARSAAIRTAS